MKCCRDSGFHDPLAPWDTWPFLIHPPPPPGCPPPPICKIGAFVLGAPVPTRREAVAASGARYLAQSLTNPANYPQYPPFCVRLFLTFSICGGSATAGSISLCHHHLLLIDLLLLHRGFPQLVRLIGVFHLRPIRHRGFTRDSRRQGMACQHNADVGPSGTRNGQNHCTWECVHCNKHDCSWCLCCNISLFIL